MKVDVKKFKAYKLIEFDDKERAVCVVQKHRFGLLLIYFFGILVSLAILYASVFLSLWIENNGDDRFTRNGDASLYILIAGALMTAVTLLVCLVYAYIFGNNVMLVTSDKLAQVIQRSPFNRKISQLNISDVQDVTVTQVGIFARLLNFGTLVIETAGEQENYTFTFASTPHECSKEIMTAREQSISKFGN